VAESVQLRVMPMMSTDLAPSAIAEHIRDEGGPVLNVPFDSGDASVVLQITHGQPILSGMGENSSYFKPSEHLSRMETNSFLRFLDDIILEREETQTFTKEDRAAVEAQGFRWVILFREQVLATQTRFYNDADDAVTDQLSFNEMQPKTAFDVQRELSEHLGPAYMVDGQYVLWDLQNPQTTSCCPDEYDYIEGWTEASNSHFEALEKLGRADNKIDTQTDTNWLDPSEVPPDDIPMPIHGRADGPPPAGGPQNGPRPGAPPPMGEPPPRAPAPAP
jgi:hypothetical protein